MLQNSLILNAAPPHEAREDILGSYMALPSTLGIFWTLAQHNTNSKKSMKCKEWLEGDQRVEF